MPSPLVWTALIAAFLGFGVIVGRATGPAAMGSLAASRAPLKLLVAKVPAASAPITTPSASPPPLPEAESTPEPSTVPASTSKSPSQGSTGGASHSSSKSPSSSRQTAGSGPSPAGGGPTTKLPAIKHVFVVMLSDEPYATAFGPASPAHYLSGTLEKQGKLLVRYYAVAHEGLANGIALLSGQGPTEATAANCPTYGEITPASASADGQVIGKGCVYPSSTRTLMSQLEAKHLTWKAYIEGIGEGATSPTACPHPTAGAADPSASLVAGSAPSYQTWRNPFVYFQAIAGSPACAIHDVGMDGLGGELAAGGPPPRLLYIPPGPCDDGSPNACAPGKASGMTAADGFLQRIVPKILSSKAYKQGGLLAIT